MEKKVILTGTSRGLGLSIANELIRKGYKVIGISRHSPEELKNNNKYRHISFDLSNVNDIKKMWKNEIEYEGPIYGYIANAAYAYDDLLTNLNIDNLIKMFKINVFSHIILAKYVVRNMLLYETKGSIVMISSISATKGFKGLTMYGATKGALEAFVVNAAREWGRYNIRFNAVAPGFMETDMTARIDTVTKERIYNRNSIKGPVKIESVVETVLFLLSDKSSSITGTVVRVDNGAL